MNPLAIPVVEVFGPVIQGEGAQAGRPTIFVRTGGCDFRCSWCDTMYAVDAERHSIDWHQMGAADIVSEVLVLAGDNHRPVVTLSGGNPAIWPLGPLVKALAGHGFRTAIETQGTVLPDWIGAVDFVTISPKPPSSGQPFNQGQFLAWLHECPTACMKVVVANEADLDFAQAMRVLAYRETAWTGPLYLQPCNTAVGEGSPAERLAGEYDALCQMVLARGWTNVRVLPQLHALAHGTGRGR